MKYSLSPIVDGKTIQQTATSDDGAELYGILHGELKKDTAQVVVTAFEIPENYKNRDVETSLFFSLPTILFQQAGISVRPVLGENIEPKLANKINEIKKRINRY